mgnify:CR=1 FL=1
MKETSIYDVAIIGTGPAGLAASIYASRYRLSNIFFGKLPGGAISEAHKVCNYPGFEDISGMELSMNFYNHAKSLGGEHILEHVMDIKKEKNLFHIVTDVKKEYFAKTVILAVGTSRNKLNLKNEDNYLGKGLSYCATCDASFYKEKIVAIIGGSSAATMAATMLADIAKRVYIIYRGTKLRGEPAWIEEVKQKENIQIIYMTIVSGLEGEEKLERIKLSKEYNGSKYLDLDGIFVEVGSVPNVDLAKALELKLDKKGYIEVQGDQSTSLEGVWAAGDCTTSSNRFRQVITAASEGSIASNAIFTYLKKKKNS